MYFKISSGPAGAPTPIAVVHSNPPCSLYIEHIPFIFCFGTSARPDFLRVCLPHRTLTALRIAKFSTSHTASEICETVLRKVGYGTPLCSLLLMLDTRSISIPTSSHS